MGVHLRHHIMCAMSLEGSLISNTLYILDVKSTEVDQRLEDTTTNLFSSGPELKRTRAL